MLGIFYIITAIVLSVHQANCLRCYICVSSTSGNCGAAQLQDSQLQTCAAGKNYCESTFAAKGQGNEVTRRCTDTPETGACINSTMSVGICTCNTDKCNNGHLILKAPGPTTNEPGGGASAVHTTGYLAFLMTAALLFVF